MRNWSFLVVLLAVFTVFACSKDDKDTTAPVITITSPAEGSILEKGKTYPVTGTVTDDTELAEISAGGVKITNFNSKTSFTFENFNLPISANTPDGDGYLEIIAKDKAGNIATKKVSFSIQ